jgi:membrane associated rhomboid family serine protease
VIPIKDYAGPRRRLPWVTWGLIVVNVVVFLYQVSLGPDAPAFMFIFIFFTIVTLPAIILIGVWFVLQLFDGVATLSTVQQGMGGVAYFAHVGGFVTGLIITFALRPLLRPPANVSYPYLPRHPNAIDRPQWWR